MDRYFDNETAARSPAESAPGEAWLFARAVLGKPMPSTSAAEADARAKREQFEFLEQIAPERARELRGQLCEEAEARANREQMEFLEQIAPERARELRGRLSEEVDPRAAREYLEWLAAISPRHESQLRSLVRTEAEYTETQERWQRPADGSPLHEAQWDSAKHPRGGYPQNRGQWSPTAGSASADKPTSKPDRPGADGQPKATGQTGVPPLMLELANAWAQTDSLLKQCRRDIETLPKHIEMEEAQVRSQRYGHLHAPLLRKAQQDLETAKALVPQLETQLRSLEKEYHDLGYDDIEYSTWSAGEMRVGGRGIERVGGALQMGGAPAGLTPTGIEFDVALAAVPIFRLGKLALSKALVKTPANVAPRALKPPVSAKEVVPKTNAPYVHFNEAHAGSQPIPKGIGPNGGRVQSHHGLQQEWAMNNIPGYDPKLAPTVTIETGRRFPHTTLSNLQNARRDARIAKGLGKWSSTIDDELGFIVNDFRAAGFGDDVIKQVLAQNYRLLDKLGVKYNRPAGF